MSRPLVHGEKADECFGFFMMEEPDKDFAFVLKVWAHYFKMLRSPESMVANLKRKVFMYRALEKSDLQA
jgi:hypothetical protein